MHRKRNRLLWFTYYCPVKNRKERLRIDARGGCPICGMTFEWQSLGDRLQEMEASSQ